MDSFFARAKSFAEEAAKKSQELASQTAKYSQDLASQTAKYSKELASETAKYGEQLSKNSAFQDLAKKSQALAQEAARRSQELAKEAAVKLPVLAQQTARSAEEGLSQLVKELKVGGAVGGLGMGAGTVAVGDEQELEEYGVTEDLREFVRELTLDTFKNFPVDEQIKGE